MPDTDDVPGHCLLDMGEDRRLTMSLLSRGHEPTFCKQAFAGTLAILAFFAANARHGLAVQVKDLVHRPHLKGNEVSPELHERQKQHCQKR